MPPILFHGLSQLSLPVVCVESRQAYQALKSLATHKTDRNDARGLGNQSGEVDYTGGISRNPATGGCEPSCTRPLTSC